MAVYTVENTLKAGKPVRIFDAAGREVEKCFFCDDSTGKIKRFALDRNGSVLINATRDGAVIVEEIRPLPFIIKGIQCH